MSADRQPKVRTMQAVLRAQQVTPWPTNLTTTLRYDPTDPLVMRLIWDGDSSRPWICARDLFADGLESHAGFGDVRMWPGAELLNVALSGEGGNALFQLPAPAVRRFLNRTYRQVPRGAEADLIDVDGLVARLLAETP